MALHSTILTIDQSYTRPGLCVARNGELLRYYSLDYGKRSSKRDKRLMLRWACQNEIHIHFVEAIILEAPRRYPSYMTMLAMRDFITTIEDAVTLPIYTVDTRNWKACTVGNPNATKDETLQYLEREYRIKGINDDIGDAICMALSYWNSAKVKRLK